MNTRPDWRLMGVLAGFAVAFICIAIYFKDSFTTIHWMIISVIIIALIVGYFLSTIPARSTPYLRHVSTEEATVSGKRMTIRTYLKKRRGTSKEFFDSISTDTASLSSELDCIDDGDAYAAFKRFACAHLSLLYAGGNLLVFRVCGTFEVGYVEVKDQKITYCSLDRFERVWVHSMEEPCHIIVTGHAY